MRVTITINWTGTHAALQLFWECVAYILHASQQAEDWAIDYVDKT